MKSGSGLSLYYSIEVDRDDRIAIVEILSSTRFATGNESLAPIRQSAVQFGDIVKDLSPTTNRW